MNLLAFQWITVLVIPSVVLAGYGDLRIRGRTNTGILEIQIGDGYWGTVCSNGFDHNAATVACRQLGYRNLAYEVTTDNTQLPIAICYTQCNGDENSLGGCILRYHCSLPNYDHLTCTHYNVTKITCITSHADDDSSTSNGVSASAIIGAIIGVLVIIAISCIMCLAYLKYYQFRQRNFIAQQQRPRILIARVTHTTTGPPPPPPYTPTQPTSEYTPVPPRAYQPVATDEYTTTPAAPSSDDIPSEPPPEYTPSVSVNVSSPPVSWNSNQ